MCKKYEYIKKCTLHVNFIVYTPLHIVPFCVEKGCEHFLFCLCFTNPRVSFLHPTSKPIQKDYGQNCTSNTWML